MIKCTDHILKFYYHSNNSFNFQKKYFWLVKIQFLIINYQFQLLVYLNNTQAQSNLQIQFYSVKQIRQNMYSQNSNSYSFFQSRSSYMRDQCNPEQNKFKINPNQNVKQNIFLQNFTKQYYQQIVDSLIKKDSKLMIGAMFFITQHMRIDVNIYFDFQNQTLHLAISLLDQFIIKNQISKQQLQLVGLTCLWIASKFVQLYPKNSKQILEVCTDIYSINQLMELQTKILFIVNFDLLKTTSYLLLKILGLEIQRQSLCLYIIELSILNGINKNYQGRILVEASLRVHQLIMMKQNCGEYIKSIQESNNKLWDCFKDMINMLTHNTKNGLSAIKTKFSYKKYRCVSNLVIKLQIYEKYMSRLDKNQKNQRRLISDEIYKSS